MKKTTGIKKEVERIARGAKVASKKASLLSTEVKNKALLAMADALLKESKFILAENKKDVDAAKKAEQSSAFVARLILNDKRLKGMSDSLREIAHLEDPIGQVIRMWKRPNGLEIAQVRVPIGVIGIIYESRPNVTSDCVGLCVKSGNCVILRGGKEALKSNKAIFKVLNNSAINSGVPKGCINLVDRPEHEAVNALLALNNEVDLIIPRGGESLIRAVEENSKIPVIKQYKGVCHTYVDEAADLEMADEICYNAKVQRPEVCNAMETLLVHKRIAGEFLPRMINHLKSAGVEIRGCPKTRAIVKGIKAVQEKDWPTEYLDLILSVKVVDSLQEALKHISKYGSNHSEAIVTNGLENATRFLEEVDAACVYVNASTRFTDGGQFGMGAEIGISTDKLHARGPMGLNELTSYKYVIYGSGQVRE